MIRWRKIYLINNSTSSLIDDAKDVLEEENANEWCQFNLFKLNSESEIAWKANFKKPTSQFQCSPLVNITSINGKLIATDFMGRQFEVNITTGGLKIIGFTK